MQLGAVGQAWRGPPRRYGETKRFEYSRSSIRHMTPGSRSDRTEREPPPHPPRLLRMVEEPQDARRQKIGAAGWC